MLGEVIGGRYRTVELIGQGGHGSVFRAQQVGLEREVALKLLHPQRLDPVSKQRFEREAELAQRLSHPNTIRLLDFGVHGNDAPYIVFELLKGRTLKELMRREAPLSDARAARIATQVLKALMEAHSVGIVHRDIKPTNIFVGEYAGEPDFVKVVDFGIAKSLRTNTKVLTRGGEVMGTPSYMAPEHIESRAVAPSTDLYSLGLVMAEMLSGKRVFDGPPIDVCMAQASSDPVPLPEHAQYSTLRDVLVRACRKKMEERYQTAAEMLRDVEVAVMSTSSARITGSIPSHPFVPSSVVPYSAVPTSSPTYHPFPTNPPSGPMSGPMSFASVTPQPENKSLALPLALLALAVGLAVAIGVVFFVRGKGGDDPMQPAPIPMPSGNVGTQPITIQPDMADAMPSATPIQPVITAPP